MRLRRPQLVLAIFLMAGPVRAQASDLDKAHTHFAAGRKLRASGRCDLAIEEFSRAADFEPNKVGPKLNLGDCYVELGRLPEAFRQFKEAERIAELAKDERRLANARASSALVEAKMVRVVLREETRGDNVTVQVDGVSIGAAPWYIVVTPEVEHDIRASAPDGRSWNVKTKRHAGEVERLTIALTVERASDGPSAERDAPVRESGERSQSVPAESAKSSEASGQPSTIPWRTVGWAGVGLGVVGIGIGIVFGLVAGSDKRDASCDANGYCDAGALASARSHATAANIGFIAGGVLAAGGIAVLVLAPGGQAAPRVKAQATGVIVEGVW